MRTGILLPKSTTHPLLAHDFVEALRAAFPEGEQPELLTANIGFGTRQEELYSAAEKMWLEQRADLLVVLADHPNVDVLFPLAASLNRPLLVVNSGAKYPVTWEPPKGVFFLNLQEWLNAYLSGSRAAAEGPGKGIFASSFYDGGYSASHAMSEGYTQHGGSIEYNFIGKHLLQEFDASPLRQYLREASENPVILSLLSGNLVPEFMEQLREENSVSPELYANPAMLYELLSLKKNYPLPVQGYLSWWPSLEGEANRDFCSRFRSVSGREASPFALLGWETALLMQDILRNGLHLKADEILAHFADNSFDSPRGILELDPDTHSFSGPAYRLRLEGEQSHLEALGIDLYKNTLKAFKAAVPEPPQTGWINTYLCS